MLTRLAPFAGLLFAPPLPLPAPRPALPTQPVSTGWLRGWRARAGRSPLRSRRLGACGLLSCSSSPACLPWAGRSSCCTGAWGAGTGAAHSTVHLRTCPFATRQTPLLLKIVCNPPSCLTAPHSAHTFLPQREGPFWPCTLPDGVLGFLPRHVHQHSMAQRGHRCAAADCSEAGAHQPGPSGGAAGGAGDQPGGLLCAARA